MYTVRSWMHIFGEMKKTRVAQNSSNLSYYIRQSQNHLTASLDYCEDPARSCENVIFFPVQTEPFY